jgi:hypothetical protein
MQIIPQINQLLKQSTDVSGIKLRVVSKQLGITLDPGVAGHLLASGVGQFPIEAENLWNANDLST